MAEPITIVVRGTPAPQGSKRAIKRKDGGVSLVESSKAVKPWRADVKAAAEATGSSMLRCPCAIEVIFWLGRPKGHYGTGRNAGVLRGAAPPHPAGKPDIDKLLRSTLDALKSAGIYEDDAQVITVAAGKRYARRGQAPGAFITVREVWEQEP